MHIPASSEQEQSIPKQQASQMREERLEHLSPCRFSTSESSRTPFRNNTPWTCHALSRSSQYNCSCTMNIGAQTTFGICRWLSASIPAPEVKGAEV
eukprot:505513-Pelagomonas_calceolata.AAC.3